MNVIQLAKAIQRLNSKARYTLKGGDLDTLYWAEDHEGVKPSPEEILAEYARLEAEAPVQRIKDLRRAAYSVEADPLFFKWQAGEVTKEEWETARETVKTKHPY